MYIFSGVRWRNTRLRIVREKQRTRRIRRSARRLTYHKKNSNNFMHFPFLFSFQFNKLVQRWASSTVSEGERLPIFRGDPYLSKKIYHPQPPKAKGAKALGGPISIIDLFPCIRSSKL